MRFFPWRNISSVIVVDTLETGRRSAERIRSEKVMSKMVVEEFVCIVKDIEILVV